MKRFLLWIPLFLAFAACGSGSNSDTDGGTNNHDGNAGDPCEAGQTRCDRQSYQECKDGLFTQTTVCQAPTVCAQDLGCVQCNPKVATTCVGNQVHECNSDGTIGNLLETCSGQCQYGECEGGCSSAAQLIYVVDDSYRLLSFNPAGGANEFKLIHALSCPASPSWPDWGNSIATPFSMSVDRSARAWVLYTSGEIFWVDTSTGQCSKSTWTPGKGGYKLFGMGFVSDTEGSDSEKLYIAGGDVGALELGNVGYIDPVALDVTTVGPVPDAEYSPELTGTGDAKLYAYFPGTNNSFVAQLNKTTGAVLQNWPLPSLSGTVRAWAFAHWGGKFYIFITAGSNSRVLKLDPDSGQTITLLENLPYRIVGAGVSTCAPTHED